MRAEASFLAGTSKAKLSKAPLNCAEMIHARKIAGAGSRIRTDDLLITNQLLYQLSYAGERTAQLSLQDRREQVVAEPGKAGQLLPCDCAKWPSEYQKELGDPAD